jgi:hypothetical protein
MGFIENAIKDMVTGVIEAGLTDMFKDINDSLVNISANVSRTPQEWNGSIFNMVQSISENVIMPIAGLVLTFVLGYEIITMVVNRNNMHDFDVSNIFQYIFKCFIAIIVVTNAWSIVNAIFSLGKYIVEQATGVIVTDAALDGSTLTGVMSSLEDEGIGTLLLIALEVTILRFAMNIMGLLITVTLYGRMVEIYLVISVAPVPFSTMANRDWSQIGRNYIQNLAALAFQGVFMVICLGIYAALVSGAMGAAITDPDTLHSTLWGLMGYTVLLVLTLRKCGTIAKQVLHAH